MKKTTETVLGKDSKVDNLEEKLKMTADLHFYSTQKRRKIFLERFKFSKPAPIL
jgi:hypothetical protein